MINKFPERMKKLRERYNLSQTDIAYLLNETPVQVGNWERGDRKPNLDTIIKLSSLFNTTSDYLIGATNIFSPHSKLIEDDNCYNKLLNDVKDYIGEENYQRFFNNKETFKNDAEQIIFSLDELLNENKKCLSILNKIPYYTYDPIESENTIFGDLIEDDRIWRLNRSYNNLSDQVKTILDDYKQLHYTLGLLESVVLCDNTKIEKAKLQEIYPKIDFDKFNTSFIHHLYLLYLQGK